MRKAVKPIHQQRRDYIVANAATMSDEAMARHLGTTKNNVKHIRKRLGIVRDTLTAQELRASRARDWGWSRRTREKYL